MIGYVPKKKIPSPPVLKLYCQQNIVYHQAIISGMPAFPSYAEGNNNNSWHLMKAASSASVFPWAILFDVLNNPMREVLLLYPPYRCEN